MNLLIKYKNVFIVLFFISLCVSLYYYFNNYTTSVKKQYTLGESQIIISLKSSKEFTANLNEKIHKKLQTLLWPRSRYISYVLSKHFNVKDDQINTSNTPLILSLYKKSERKSRGD